MDPFYAAYETSLSKLDDHEWNIIRNRWARGIDWCVGKVGRKWQVIDCFGRGWPLFKTKTAAHDAVSNLVVAESHWRGKLRWDVEHASDPRALVSSQVSP